MAKDDRNIEKDLTVMTDFDISELYIKCVSVFVETASRAEMQRGDTFILGQRLWKETLEALKEYRQGNRKTHNGM